MINTKTSQLISSGAHRFGWAFARLAFPAFSVLPEDASAVEEVGV